MHYAPQCTFLLHEGDLCIWPRKYAFCLLGAVKPHFVNSFSCHLHTVLV